MFKHIAFSIKNTINPLNNEIIGPKIQSFIRLNCCKFYNLYQKWTASLSVLFDSERYDLNNIYNNDKVTLRVCCKINVPKWVKAYLKNE